MAAEAELARRAALGYAVAPIAAAALVVAHAVAPAAAISAALAALAAAGWHAGRCGLARAHHRERTDDLILRRARVPEVDARSRELVARRHRRGIAHALAAHVTAREGPRTPLATLAAHDNQATILRIAARLRDDARVEARGVVLARRLVADVDSPLRGADAAALAIALIDVERAL